jgi:hypothetical protein
VLAQLPFSSSLEIAQSGFGEVAIRLDPEIIRKARGGLQLVHQQCRIVTGLRKTPEGKNLPEPYCYLIVTV